MFKAIRFIMLGSLVACASPTPSTSYTLVLDDSLSSETKEQAVEAVQAWETILDGKLSIQIKEGHCVDFGTSGPDSAGVVDYAIGKDLRYICIRTATLALLDSLESARGELGMTMRLADVDAATIYLPVSAYTVTPQTWTKIIMHELGHGMGLEHTQTGTIMCWALTCQSASVDCDDTAQWASVRGMTDKSASCPKGGNYTLEH